MGFGEKFGRWAGIIGAAGTIGGAAEAQEIPQQPEKETTIIVDSGTTEHKPTQDVFTDGANCENGVCQVEIGRTPIEEARIHLEEMKKYLNKSQEDYDFEMESWKRFVSSETFQEAMKTDKELQQIVDEINQLIQQSEFGK